MAGDHDVTSTLKHRAGKERARLTRARLSYLRSQPLFRHNVTRCTAL
jgi:hypothetical protein